MGQGAAVATELAYPAGEASGPWFPSLWNREVKSEGSGLAKWAFMPCAAALPSDLASVRFSYVLCPCLRLPPTS